ncbi:hypothetical protein KR032_008421 [Drosophila birchii]|nr:hypothetical protein KR032_008421 [Drosophila birchii]
MSWLLAPRNKLSLGCKVMIYKAILAPSLFYGLQVYGIAAKSNLNKIRILQAKTLRRITGAPWYMRTSDIERDLKVPKIDVAGDVAGNVADYVAGNVADDVAGNVAGNVADDVAGNVAGNVARDVRSGVTDDDDFITVSQGVVLDPESQTDRNDPLDGDCSKRLDRIEAKIDIMSKEVASCTQQLSRLTALLEVFLKGKSNANAVNFVFPVRSEEDLAALEL